MASTNSKKVLGLNPNSHALPVCVGLLQVLLFPPTVQKTSMFKSIGEISCRFEWSVCPMMNLRPIQSVLDGWVCTSRCRLTQHRQNVVIGYFFLANIKACTLTDSHVLHSLKPGLAVMSDQRLYRISPTYNQCQVLARRRGRGLAWWECVLYWHRPQVLHNSLVIRVFTAARS